MRLLRYWLKRFERSGGLQRALRFVLLVSFFLSVFWATYFWLNFEGLPIQQGKPCENAIDTGFAGWNRMVLFAWTIFVLFLLASPYLRRSNDPPPIYYVPLIVIFINAQMFTTYVQYGIVATDGTQVTPSDILYFTIITFTTVGYGDFQPCPAARLFAAFHGFFGIVCAALIAILLSRVTDATRSK